MSMLTERRQWSELELVRLVEAVLENKQPAVKPNLDAMINNYWSTEDILAQAVKWYNRVQPGGMTPDWIARANLRLAALAEPKSPC